MMHELTAMIRINPAGARTKILDALREAGMHKGRAATALECRHQTLTQWIERLELGAEVEKMTARALKDGWHHGNVGGRPRDSARVRRMKDKGLMPRTPKRATAGA